MITTVIEKYLLGVDQATFQKMMNHLLHLEGHKFLGSPGSVIGKNKTSKGSPDSFFEDGDKYIFCEFTTQEKLSARESFFTKLQKDIDHCFDVLKSGIPKDKISKVILAFTEEVSAKEYDALKTKVKNHHSNATLIIYSIQEIPFRLVYYPGLADKYISGVKTTKGALYTLPDFLQITERGLQPALTNPFAGREAEINKAKAHLLSNDILIITGSQGVGKSKLAIHLAQIFETEKAYEPRVIASSPVPLWEDLNTFIFPSKKYFIVFDDANKALPNLDYVLQFINGRDKDTTKIVITVRDYVRQDIDKYFLDVPYNELLIKPLEDKELREVISKFLPEGFSLDPIVLERILSLSKGNSRLALMATSSILENNDIEILKNVFFLYDQYFQKVKNDLSFLNRPENLQALGVLAFFGVLDKTNQAIKSILENQFKINWDELWETFIELEKVELVDVFKTETAKISDQVLATYVFYKTFFDETTASINYTDWVVSFIESYPKKISKTLIDLINTFGFAELKDRVTSLILPAQKKLEKDPKRIYKFFEIFWFYREVDTLVFIKNWIDNLDNEEIELKDIKYKYEINDFVWPPEYINMLINFWEHNTAFTSEAIDLGLKLMFKQPSKIPETLKHLSQHIAFHRFDGNVGFPRQMAFVEALNNKNFSEREVLIANQIFLSLAPSFLGWEYHQTEGKTGGQLMIHNFALRKTDSLMELRKKILEKLFILFAGNEVAVLAALSKYAWAPKSFDSTVYAEEQPLMAEFIKQNLSPEKYSHCKLVYEYVEVLTERQIPLLNEWNLFLKSDTMLIAEIFSSSFDEHNLDYNEREQKQKEAIRTYVIGKDIVFIEKTLNQLESVYNSAIENSNAHSIDSNVPNLFITLAETDIQLYYQSLELMMLDKYSFSLRHGNIIFTPIKKHLVKPRDLYNRLNRYEYKQKQFWKQFFFEAIDEDDIDEFILLEFIAFLLSLKDHFDLYNLGQYIKFDKQFVASREILQPNPTFHKNVVTYITEIIMSKTNSINIFVDSKICKNSVSYFTDNPGSLKEIFYLGKKESNLYNHDGKEMAAISSLDPYFLVEYLERSTKEQDYLRSSFDSLNLTFVWDQPNYEDLLDKALEVIIKKAPIWSNFEHPANVLFKRQKVTAEQLKKVYQYISQFIAKHHKSKQHIHIILNVVTYRFNDKLITFLKEFLILNKDPQYIKDLWLEKSQVYSGSRVPHIDARLDFLKSVIEMIKTLPNPLDYAEHIKQWEKEIEWARQDKLNETKRDFSGWEDY